MESNNVFYVVDSRLNLELVFFFFCNKLISFLGDLIYITNFKDKSSTWDNRIVTGSSGIYSNEVHLIEVLRHPFQWHRMIRP